MPGKDDLHFYKALQLVYIFKLIRLQYAKPKAHHLIPKHKFSFRCTILQKETRHRWVHKLSGNIQSQTTPISPKEQWSMTVWIAKRYCQRAPPKLPALNLPRIMSCSSNNFVYVCYGTCLERHLEHWDTALSPNIKIEMKYSLALLSPNSRRGINKT